MSRPTGSSTQEPETFYSKATKAELNKDWDQAFPLYIKAAEGYLYLSRTTTDEKLRSHCKLQAGRALERAEKIKGARRDLAPVAVNPFSEQEQFRILHKSSFIHLLRFPLWDEPAYAQTSNSSYEDPDGQPPLSLEQRKHLPTWRTPSEACPQAVMASLLWPQSIVQHIVTDCSVCTSLVVCVEHHRRFASKLLLSSLYPQDANGIPKFSESGQYLLRFFVNGAYRCICEQSGLSPAVCLLFFQAIDEKLPFAPISNTPLCMTTIPQHLTWPALVEKAYMKLMGGYDFPGSNSSIDLHALAGWIPEHIEIKSPAFERERTWSRIIQGFSEGKCVLTVGTDQQECVLWREVQLLPSHSYAVIDVSETEEDRIFTILDPWRPTTSESHPLQESRTLQVPWDDICDVFHGIYLSWDPEMFEHQLAFHGMWKMTNANEESVQASNRHMRLMPDASQTGIGSNDVWILLTRHIVDTRRASEYISLRVQSQDDLINQLDTHRLSSKVSYTSSAHVLIRAQVTSSTKTLSIFASYDGTFEDVGFSITAYSPFPMSWDETIPKVTCTTNIEGTLTSKNAGGNCMHSSFMVNPQYHLRIHPDKKTMSTNKSLASAKANVDFILHGSRQMPLNIVVVWSQGERVMELIQKDIAANSGAYTYGGARIMKALPIGDYSVIISAFEPDHLGKFSLRIESSHPFDFQNIPQEGAGAYSKIMYGAWNAETAKGGPTFKQYSQNPIYELELKAATQLRIRLQLRERSQTTSLNITLFPNTLDGSLGRHIATSGPYSEAISGVVIPELSLSPGKYLLVPSTYTPGVHTSFRLIVYSTASGMRISER